MNDFTEPGTYHSVTSDRLSIRRNKQKDYPFKDSNGVWVTEDRRGKERRK